MTNEEEDIGKVQCYGFADAFERMRGGSAFARQGWNGKGMNVTVQIPSPLSKMTRPYLVINVPEGTSKQFETKGEHHIPWLPSQTDLFAFDWFEVC